MTERADPPGLTHAQLAAMLVAEGCLRIVERKQPAKMPIEALPLTAEEKAKAGADPDALAVFYPLGDTGVFMQMNGPHARVWYNGECDNVVVTFERALQRAYPQAAFLSELDHHEERGMRLRVYRVEVDPKHLAYVEATFPTDQEARQQFVVRVHAQERR